MKKALLIAVMGLSFLMMACAQDTQPQMSESFALDTLCTQQVYGENADQAIADVTRMLQDLTRELSMNEGSYVYDINTAASEPAAVPDSVARLIETAAEIADETKGAFDPTIGVISRLWDISGNPRVPSAEEISAARPLVDYRYITVDGTAVSLEKSGMILDLGGIGKGYAADCAVEIYREYGITSALVNLGGNIYAYGTKPDGNPYRIGLRDPYGNEGDYAAVISVSDASVVTSGIYERSFESDGRAYHHILDPKTGYPADNELASVTVVCANSTEADALSTGLFVMGLEKGLAFAQADPDIEAVFITKDKAVFITDGLKENIELTNETYTIQS